MLHGTHLVHHGKQIGHPCSKPLEKLAPPFSAINSTLMNFKHFILAFVACVLLHILGPCPRLYLAMDKNAS